MKPTIYAGNQIDLEIKQEVSEAVQNKTSGLSTPVINNRTVSTQLSLQDGATVLLGGLIMENSSSTSTGIPGFKEFRGWVFCSARSRWRKRAANSSSLLPPISSSPARTRNGWPTIQAAL